MGYSNLQMEISILRACFAFIICYYGIHNMDFTVYMLYARVVENLMHELLNVNYLMLIT